MNCLYTVLARTWACSMAYILGYSMYRNVISNQTAEGTCSKAQLLYRRQAEFATYDQQALVKACSSVH